MNNENKNTRGQPSKEIGDREALLWMLELWRAGKSGRSPRKISRMVVGLEAISPYEDPKISSKEDWKAQKPKPSSVANPDNSREGGGGSVTI